VLPPPALAQRALTGAHGGPTVALKPALQPAPRDPSLAHVSLSDASHASRKPHKTDDLDASGRILRPWTRLRALWGDFPVVVRVHSSALRKPWKSGLFLVRDSPSDTVTTATAEWYRSLAEWGLSPQDHIPYDHHRWRHDLQLADLSDIEQLRPRLTQGPPTESKHMACLSTCR
jgi:hypothetical protein